MIEWLHQFRARLDPRYAARRSFPNNLGNYRGKRKPKPAGKPLEPRERFARLVAMHVAARGTYRNPPSARRGEVRADLLPGQRARRGVFQQIRDFFFPKNP